MFEEQQGQQEQQITNAEAGPSTDLTATNQPAGTQRIPGFDIQPDAQAAPVTAPATAKPAGAPVDYAALAKQFGSVGSEPTPIDYAALAKKFGSVGSEPTVVTQPRTAPQQSHDLLTRTFAGMKGLTTGGVNEQPSNAALEQAKNVSDYVYNNILGKDAYQHSNLQYDETPTSAWGTLKQRMWGWLTQDEINKLPGLEPDRVEMLRQQGQDILAAGGVPTMLGPTPALGKKNADYLREHILNGSVVLNVPPEEFARAAAKTVTDYFSPGYYALGAFGRVAQGYQKAGQAAAAAGDMVKAASAMGKARLLGLLGTSVNVPFAASQAHDLVEHWDNMSVPERVAAVSGILGASINTHVGIDAAGGYKKVAGDVANVANQAASSVPVQATKKAVGSLASFGGAQDFNTAIKRASNITAKNYNEHLSKIQNASGDLQAILNKNPHIESPQDFADGITKHIEEQEQALQAAAGATQHDTAPVVPDFETRLSDRLDKFFADTRGKYGTQADDAEAKEDLINRVMQQEGKNSDGSPILRAPNLFESENIRQGLNIDTKPQINGKPTTNAYKAGLLETANVMREAIDESYDTRGIENVKEFRQKEANLIDIRDQLAAAQKRAEDMGNGGLWDGLMKKFGAPSTLLAVALGVHGGDFGYLTPYLLGGVAVKGLAGIAENKVHQNLKNPVVNINRARKLASPNAKATELNFRPTTGVQPPPAGTPTAGIIVPPHVLAGYAAAVSPALMDESPTNHKLNAELATHFNESFDHAPLDERIERVKNTVEAMRKSGLELTPIQAKALGAINKYETNLVEAIEKHQKKHHDETFERVSSRFE